MKAVQVTNFCQWDRVAMTTLSLSHLNSVTSQLCHNFRFLNDPMATLEAMFNPKLTSLPGHIQSVYVQNVTKLYSSVLVKAEIAGDEALVRRVGQLLLDNLPMYVQSADLEVQERVGTYALSPFSSLTIALLKSYKLSKRL